MALKLRDTAELEAKWSWHLQKMVKCKIQKENVYQRKNRKKTNLDLTMVRKSIRKNATSKKDGKQERTYPYFLMAYWY